MRNVICIVLFLLVLTSHARAAELPEDLTDALPDQAAEWMEEIPEDDFAGGVTGILEQMGNEAGDIVRQRVRGAAGVLVAVVICGILEGAFQGIGGKASPFLPMVGALSVTLLTAGSLDSLMGLGASTIEDLSVFSRALLPTLAAATAASGSVTTATVQQVTTVFLVDVLVSLIRGLLVPLVYVYVGVLAASAALSESRLGVLAEGLKKAVTWCLTTALVLFTVYLSVSRVVTGSVDAASVKVARAAISGVVPVVGGIISDAAETVLAGAGMLKNTVGVFGMLAILAACAYPFLQLGIQYLLYKLTAFAAGAVGAPGLHKLIDGLGGAFGLILGMTGSCALLLLISVLSSVAAVVP